MSITTLRPSATSSGVGWTPSAGTLHGVTSDDSDLTYATWTGDGSPMILATPVDSPPAGERRHQVRLRARGEDGTAWWAVRLSSGSLVAGAAASFAASPETIVGSWGTGAPADGSTTLYAYVTGQSTGVRITELYLDMDSREAPTFTAQILDGSGAVTTTISDTAQPSIRATSIDLDALDARQYRYWVTLGTDIVWDTGVVSGAAGTRQTAPLENGSYVAHLQIWSTLGADTAYASDEETLAFDVAVGAVPDPDAPTVTVEAPFYRIEVCAPDTSEFDDGTAWLELQRIDCLTPVVIAILGPLTTDQCAEWVDFTLPRSGVGRTCDHEPDECCSYYRARTLGRIDGSLLVSDWSEDSGPELFCLEWPQDEHLIRSADWQGPLYAPILGKFDWTVDRPFTAAVGLMGARFVTSAPPGGRNLTMSAAVESEADLAQLRAVLARPLVLISPSDANEVWAAPVAESVNIIKIGRIRHVSAQFIGTGPEPPPQLADVGV